MSKHKKDSILKISSFTDHTFIQALKRLDMSMRRFQYKKYIQILASCLVLK